MISIFFEIFTSTSGLKVIKIFSIKAIILSVTLLYPLFGFVNEASAENSRCSLATLKGTYTFNAQGYIISDSLAVPDSYIGMVYFDGLGKGKIVWYFSGTPDAITANATYLIDANCHATVTYNTTPNKVFDYFVAPNGDSVQWVIKSPDNLSFSAESKRVSKKNLLDNK